MDDYTFEQKIIDPPRVSGGYFSDHPWNHPISMELRTSGNGVYNKKLIITKGTELTILKGHILNVNGEVEVEMGGKLFIFGEMHTKGKVYNNGVIRVSGTLVVGGFKTTTTTTTDVNQTKNGDSTSV